MVPKHFLVPPLLFGLRYLNALSYSVYFFITVVKSVVVYENAVKPAAANTGLTAFSEMTAHFTAVLQSPWLTFHKLIHAGSGHHIVYKWVLWCPFDAALCGLGCPWVGGLVECTPQFENHWYTVIMIVLWIQAVNMKRIYHGNRYTAHRHICVEAR